MTFHPCRRSLGSGRAIRPRDRGSRRARPRRRTCPDERCRDGDEIGRFTDVHAPGYASEHHALVDEAGDIAVLGDTVFGADARQLPAGHFTNPMAFFLEDFETADDPLANPFAYDFDVGFVYHGESITSDASEKLERSVDCKSKPE